jgi:ribosomal-protein-alanine N-acetyltransferase
MNFRAYLPSDLDAMHALDVVCFERPFRFTRRAMQRFAEMKKALVLIAEIDGILAGFCILHVENAEDASAGYIVTLDVGPQHRHSGMGRALMQQAEIQAADAGCSLIVLHVYTGNTDAIAFYERLGFTVSHRDEGFYGIGRAAFAYVKRVAPEAPPHAIQWGI